MQTSVTIARHDECRAAYESARFRVTLEPSGYRIDDKRSGRTHVESRPLVLAAFSRGMSYCAGRGPPRDVRAADKLLAAFFPPPLSDPNTS